ncbi:PTS sugar transporter subunit IIC [uncultured Lactobacillus sp.]|uniref:PTS sugar transporter subunit IIC n=1 Tax=uncultured Lactobacillus sp. TaxID=153152 RepID=UPI0025EA0036|nr:PTS sugar transporter subunit IIC [uncultured Lactobacillus sp.]
MKVFILTALAFLLGIDNVSTKMFRRPLLIAPIVGIILGNLQAGLIIGATLEVMWMGIGDVGAYMAPDIITGTMISTSLAIMGNTSGNIFDNGGNCHYTGCPNFNFGATTTCFNRNN